MQYDTWPPEAWKTSAARTQLGQMATTCADRLRPHGSPKFNFYGANRIGADLFGDSLIALDARTGKRLWHFQMVHHDVWDYDNTTAPKLLTIRRNGVVIDVVAQPGKTGWLYVFNRVTGEPIWPIEERPVPAAVAPGEQLSPTQPFPTNPPPFARQSFTEKDISPYIDDPAEKARFLEDIRGSLNQGMFTPLSTEKYTMQMPGNNGGSNFGSAAVDPQKGVVYVISKDWPSLLKLSLPANATPQYDGSMPYTSGLGFMVTTQGMSAIAPPWTQMTAIDVAAGTIKWQITVGEICAAKGIRHRMQFPVGPVVTAGRLIFTGTRDRRSARTDADTSRCSGRSKHRRARRDAGGVSDQRQAVHRLLRGGNASTRTRAVLARRGRACAALPRRGPPAAAGAPRRRTRRGTAGRGGGRGGGTAIQGAYVAFALK